MKRPVLSLLIAATWLLLQQSPAVPQLITAAVLGLLLPRLLHGFLGPATPLRAPLTALRFTALVLWDIVVSNVTVAGLVLDPRSRPQPAWVRVPLTLQHPTAISLLASVITTTPGTVSCEVDEQRREILVHALDCSDPAALVEQIQQRYEAPLMEIFG
ncbi:Na+/H+ antiporter subunit E [Piscinibacter aquaticus]|uniref:Na+/H+ antiporter subunit E n=1 Tax=Piscinibacter aquaticus TaxID=392597 RepID=A0A5C6U1T5_9BURK|nr:Na+/H+ antiporter subunit E [Piscinibacter aquaticus]